MSSVIPVAAECDPFGVYIQEPITLAAFAYQQNCSVAQLRELNPAVLHANATSQPNGLGQEPSQPIPETEDLRVGTWLRVPPRLYASGPTIGNISGSSMMSSINDFVEDATRLTTVEEVGLSSPTTNRAVVRLFPDESLGFGCGLLGGDEQGSVDMKLVPHTRVVILPQEKLRTAMERIAVESSSSSSQCGVEEKSGGGVNLTSRVEFAESKVEEAMLDVNEGWDESPLTCVRSRHLFKAHTMLAPMTSTLCWYPVGAKGSSAAPFDIAAITPPTNGNSGGDEVGEEDEVPLAAANSGINEAQKEYQHRRLLSLGAAGDLQEKKKMKEINNNSTMKNINSLTSSSFSSKKNAAFQPIKTFFRAKMACPIFKPNPIDLVMRTNQVRPWAVTETAAKAMMAVDNKKKTSTAASASGCTAVTSASVPRVILHEMSSVSPEPNAQYNNIGDTFVVEIAVLDKAGGHVREVWQFLPSAPLTQLADVVGCGVGKMPYPYTRNSFFWLGGSFYVDDRHRQGEGNKNTQSSRATTSAGGLVDEFKDLTQTIRSWHPFTHTGMTSGEAPAFPNPNGTGGGGGGDIPGHLFRGSPHDFAFSTCPVKSASESTFADLTNVILGECGVLRHYGRCDHYFYVHSVHRVGVPLHLCQYPQEASSPATATAASAGSGQCVVRYPYMIQGVGERVLVCQACKLLPATLLSYNDRLCPRNPAPFCRRCYDNLRGALPSPEGETGGQEEGDDIPQQDGAVDHLDGSVPVELPPSCYFCHKD